MADDTTDSVEAPGLDMEAASDQIGASLFPETAEPDTPDPVETVTDALVAAPEKTAAPAPETVTTTPTVHEVPKSWAKDYHESWGKVDPKVQEYIKKRETDFLNGLEQYKGAAQYGKSMADVVTPHMPMIQAKGLDAPRAVADMLNSYAELTQGTLEQRQAAYAKVGAYFGLTLPPTGTPDGTAPQSDPRIQTLESQLNQIQQVMTQQQTAALTAAREKAGAEVNTFATATNKDGTPIHAFFDECHDDIVKFLTSGDSLPDAYDKAVWANPVTREKQRLAWFQTETDKRSERARLDALPKQKARGVNVNGRDTQRTPTEPLGSLDDTLRSTFKTIKERTVH